MSNEELKLKLSVIISATNTSGNQKLDAIMELFNQLHPSPTPDVTEAVEFLTWVDGNGFECVLHDDENIKHWQAYREGESYTTHELYKKFKDE